MQNLIKNVKKSAFFKMRSAFGQLIVLVFAPIVFLALVGGVLVFYEVKKATLSEQEALAVALMIRHEPVITDTLNKQQSDDKPIFIHLNMGTDDHFKQSQGLLGAFGRGYFSRQDWLKRMMVVDASGNIKLQTADTGQAVIFAPADGQYWQLHQGQSTFYGMPLADIKGRTYWLVAEMDNQPIVITYYRVILALLVTGLITILLLLLILAVYSKRWITPIYEMRLHLQRLNADNLTKEVNIGTDGEFFLLQRDFIQAMRRLNVNLNELKTHAKETEADLQQAFDEMEMQNITIRKARDLAVSTSAAKTAFLTNISHELRTPLNSIDGFINLLDRHEGLSGEQKLYVQTIKKSSAHLLALVNDVLDFSKMEAGKLVLDTHPFDLYAVIYDVVDMLSVPALEKHLRLSVLFYHDVPTAVVGDSLRIKQILTNLVGNAIKFTDTGSVLVKVMLADDDGFLQISVADTGKGISQDIQDSLFQSFSQGDLSITRRYGGTGLGLVISKQLTQMMGGEIGFFDNNRQNVAKSGATFWFSLPIHTQDTGEKTPADWLENSLVKGDKLRLLVWINHLPAEQVLKVSLPNADIVFAIGLADLLEQLDKSDHGFNWVIVDYFGQDAAKDDVGAVLRQIRQRYTGNLSAYGYQVGMDSTMLAECQTYALYEPLDARQLYAMLGKQNSQAVQRRQRFVGVRVLAVDDHEPNLLVLRALLGELGVEVVTVNNGFDAISTMSRAISGAGVAVDLIFMDIQMPKMSGLEASLQIRKIEEAHHAKPVPIIALTAHGLADEKEQLIRFGLSDHATKPIGLEQLVQLLQKWLQPKETQTDDLIQEKETNVQEQNVQEQIVIENLPTLPRLATDVSPQGDLPDVDWQDALVRGGNKADLAKTLLTMMIDSADSEKQALERAWADRDGTALIDITHRMVGASRYTGVPRLRQVAEIFETNCRQQILDTPSSFIAIRPSYRAVIDALDALGVVRVSDVVYDYIGE